jgi:hypothetical protein
MSTMKQVNACLEHLCAYMVPSVDNLKEYKPSVLNKISSVVTGSHGMLQTECGNVLVIRDNLRHYLMTKHAGGLSYWR